MPPHLIVDGYNLIRRSPSLSVLDGKDLQEGREELVRRLVLYKQARSISITVIFDGWGKGNLLESQTTQRGIRVVFSRKGQKADDVIVRMAREMRDKAIVVTSDRHVQVEVERHHATVIPSEDFEFKMEMASYADQGDVDSGDSDDRLSTKGTRKKGPSRRAPRDVRKAKRRIRKL